VKVLITGGAGYIGSILTQMLLESGHAVRVFDDLSRGGASLLPVWSHPAFQFMRGDVREAIDVRRALDDMDAVVHLAAIVGDPACARQPELAREVNLDASLALLAASQHAGVHRFIFASTCSNYGKMLDPNQYVNETSELRPLSLYAETKVAVEQEILDARRDGGMCLTYLRFATVFGVSPRMRFDLTVNEFILQLVTRNHLVVFGEQFWRPYLHVRDVARAVQLILGAPPLQVHRQVFNVGATDQNYRKQDLVQLMRPFAPDAVIEYVHKDEDPRDYRVSFARLEEAFAFRPTRSVEDGIREVAQLVQAGVLHDFDSPQFRN
jgi:nucleoside-diphosphate-sugar epimerase